MTASTATQNAPQQEHAGACVSVLLLDTPENLGIDFLQLLQRQELKLVYERVNDKEGLHAALRQGTWDILLVCDQVNVPGQDETLAYLDQLDCETGYILLSKSELSIDALTRAYRRGIAAVVSALHPEYSFHVFAREAERCRRNMQLSLLNQEKFDLKRHCMQLMSGTQEALAYLQDGIHVFGNDAYLKLLGYRDLDDLLILPFIDLVSTEMREKTKQRLVDYQHKVRLQPDTPELEIPELFVTAIGEREGILQVAATFKPVIHEGEACVQVIFKFAAGEDRHEESAAAEGLGYSLFITHLENLLAQARESTNALGKVLHIRGLGCEHYMARKGFGSLNGKLKALASELKEELGQDDLLIRLNETSLLALQKAGSTATDAALARLLARFDVAMNRELGAAADEPVVKFVLEQMPVDAQSPSAEQLVRSFLNARQTRHATAPAVEDAGVRQQGPVVAAPALAPAAAATASPAEDRSSAELRHISAALAGNQIKLMYETVISVADIETDFHDICMQLPTTEGSGQILARAALGSGDAAAALAVKLDRWMLRGTLAVIADLYRRGQEYPVLLPLSEPSLAERRLADVLGRELQEFGLPAAMLIVDLPLHSLGSDIDIALSRLEPLKQLGVSLCLSEVHESRAVQQLAQRLRIDRVRLQRDFVAAAQDPAAFSRLKKVVEELHASRIKVFAGDIASHSELALCCKAGIDLVKGKCIQPAPRELDAESMAEALMT
jgi:EAL domain-containing protein (putative c-di-GMP-specific phosphodiesterase class I)/PAS domain-containing protein